jgi:hypothetical protein
MLTVKPQKLRISEQELQRKFNRNDGGYNNRMHELEIVCVHDRPADPKSNQVYGTRSKIVKFKENGMTVMTVHFFVKPDASLGASGKFDPKYLIVDGVAFYIVPDIAKA